jgi:flagellar basal body rod protein FlgG
MPYGLYISADGAQAQAQRLEVIANNLANVETVGFKRELSILQSRSGEANQRTAATPAGGALENLSGGVCVQETKTDFSPGAQRKTENPTDMAIQGKGFFLVRKGEDTYLTRAGNFRIANGQLVTQQGYQVLSDDHAPISIRPEGGPWKVLASGAVQQDGSTQNLALVSPASLGDLARVGENLFRPLAAPQPLPAGERNVAPGYLELSGVQPTGELVDMLETSRLLEANINMIQTQDQTLSALVNRVLKA